MTDIHSNIKRLKTHIRLGNLDTEGNSGWKDLIPIAKSSSSERFLEDEREHGAAGSLLGAQQLTSAYLSHTVAPLEPPVDYRVCNDCGRPIAYSALLVHLQEHCRRRKESENGAKSPPPEMSPATVKQLKRSSSTDMELSPSKKQRKVATPSTKRQRKVKQRNPTEPHLVDLDKQCGVELPERGVCGRSLTCKSHSMGAKRAVQGRSKPFDVLLTEYQKKNHIKNASKGARAKGQPLNQQQKQKLLDKEQEQDVPILSPEEETTQVLNGVSRSLPLPLETNILTSTKTRTKYFRMREMFASSFSIRPGYSTPGYGAIHSRVGCIDLDRTTEYTFRIRVPQLVNQNSPQGSPPQHVHAIQHHRMKQPAQQMQDMPSITHSLPQQQMPAHVSEEHLQYRPQQGSDIKTMENLTGIVDRPITPRDVQTQQLLMQQQQQQQQHRQQHHERQHLPQEKQQQQQNEQLQRIQQRKRLEDASAQLDTASKLMQGSPINVSGSMVNNSGVGSPVNVKNQGMVNMGLNNGYDSRGN
ncbi:AFL097Cp [Eremothecium gossypii ATCC 10895]|uniref:AFL097Cp n=1 Tax=Eremothecium gossypii (strain ATCC 10895 / CBS 109.51 / FGSC 9923 / NRRL Y-1056) TaxID=284811 RepID=Q755C0_EREGS|nr:AFL097Cp [Eremothecium gossypii ATCC 10895]AAS53277.1 AFL097Cp [Eremothecium gossypii ATCC 10895]AEY97587.1 FAFL097Cp [Eremothecium gossypii FDAG1]